MKRDAKTYKEVAERCTRFDPSKDAGCRCNNSTSPSSVSCENCKHYDASNVCTLDLYREIVENHHL